MGQRNRREPVILMRFGRLVLVACLLAGLLGHSEAAQLDFSKVGIYGRDFECCDFTVYKFYAPRDEATYERYAKLVREAHDRGQFVLVGLYTYDRVKLSKPIEEYIKNTDELLSHLPLDVIDAVFLSEENIVWNNGLEVQNRLYDHVKQKWGLTVYQWYTPYDVPNAKAKADGWIIDPYRWQTQAFRKYLMKYLVTGKPVINCINASPEIEPWEASQDQVDVCREFNIPMFFYCVDPLQGSPFIWMKTDEPSMARWRGWFFRTREMAHGTDTSELPLPSADYSPGQPVEVAGDEANRFEYADDFLGLKFIDDATINGFMSLRWDGEKERLGVIASAQPPARTSLTYHLFSEFKMRDPSMAATFEPEPGAGASLRVSFSGDGHTWQDTELGRALDGFSGRNFWVRFRVEAGGGEPGRPVAWMSDLAIRGECVPPAARQVELVPTHRRGNFEYRDDFEAQRYLHLAHIEGGEDLEWERGRLSVRGAEGRIVRSALRWKFVSEKPLKKLHLAIKSYAHKQLAAHNEIGVSLDGKNLLVSDTTAGKEDASGRYVGTVEFDLSDDARFKGVTEFWVHFTMINSARVVTNRSNDIHILEVTGNI